MSSLDFYQHLCYHGRINITIHFDGSCWPNPGGLAKYGYTLRSDTGTDIRANGLVGEGPEMSNNHAELWALGWALADVLALIKTCNVQKVLVIGDSQVAIRLMSGAYRANPEKLYWPAFVRAHELANLLYKADIAVQFEWVRREFNQEADDLSKAPLSTASKELLDEADDFINFVDKQT
jgi:ribonuclease HI